MLQEETLPKLTLFIVKSSSYQLQTVLRRGPVRIILLIDLSLVPGALMFYNRYTHVGDNDKIIGEAPGRDRIQDGGFTNMLIISVLAMVFTGLERPVLQAIEMRKVCSQL